ncbi:hypothetical protein Bca101_096128 [Brassica carinata]
MATTARLPEQRNQRHCSIAQFFNNVSHGYGEAELRFWLIHILETRKRRWHVSQIRLSGIGVIKVVRRLKSKVVRILLRMRGRDLRQIVMCEMPFRPNIAVKQLLIILALHIVPPSYTFIGYGSISHRLSGIFERQLKLHIAMTGGQIRSKGLPKMVAETLALCSALCSVGEWVDCLICLRVLVETLGLIRHLKSLLYSRIREAWLAWWQIWCDGDMFELGPADGVGSLEFTNIFLGSKVPEVCLARGVLKRLLFQRFFIVSPLFSEVFAWSGLSLRFLVSYGCAWILGDPVAGSQSWVRVGSFLSRCCHPGLEVSVAARVESRDCIRVSFGVSVSRFRVLDCGNAFFALFSHNNCHIVAVASVPGVGGLVTAISSTPSRMTAPPVCGLFFVLSVLLVASKFELPISLGARGNRGLTPLIPSLGALTLRQLHH